VKRREFMALLGGVLAAPAIARSEQARAAVRIGVLPLGSQSNAYDMSLVEALRRGLRQVGLIENRDIVLDVRWITGDPDQAVADVIQRGADMLIPCGTSASLAVKRQATTIPVVFISVGNPIGIGLVESLSHPGGNATGFSDILADLGGKQVDLATELQRGRGPVDYFWHPGWADGKHRLQGAEDAAKSIGLAFRSRVIADIAELDDVIAGAKTGGALTLIIQPSPFTYQHRERIIAAAHKQHLPTIFAFPPAAREGALVAYGPDYVHMYRRAPFYVERILKGTKPADLPVEQPTKLELIVNLKTAKALGFETPISLLVRADELVE
jgi:putative ABC transport system substrate-binding protein